MDVGYVRHADFVRAMAPTVSIVVGKTAPVIRARNVAVGKEKVDAPNVGNVYVV